MKKIVLLISICLLPVFALAQDDEVDVEDSTLCSDTLRIPAEEIEPLEEFRFIINDAFGVGEKLTFTIGWKMVKAGEATIDVNEGFNHDNRPAYRVIHVSLWNGLQ